VTLCAPVEKAAENGVSGGCFRRPFHRALTRGGLVALNSFYGLAPKALRAGYFLTSDLFWLLDLLRVMARGIL
jgi:hypothetical protein